MQFRSLVIFAAPLKMSGVLVSSGFRSLFYIRLGCLALYSTPTHPSLFPLKLGNGFKQCNKMQVGLQSFSEEDGKLSQQWEGFNFRTRIVTLIFLDMRNLMPVALGWMKMSLILVTEKKF